MFFEKDVLQCRYANGVVVHAEPSPGDSTGSSGGARCIGTDAWIAVDPEAIYTRSTLRPWRSNAPLSFAIQTPAMLGLIEA